MWSFILSLTAAQQEGGVNLIFHPNIHPYTAILARTVCSSRSTTNTNEFNILGRREGHIGQINYSLQGNPFQSFCLKELC